MSLYGKYPTIASGGSGIATYPTFSAFPPSAPDGTLALALDTDILYVYSVAQGAWLPIGGPGVALSIGTIDSATPSANGAVITSNQLVMQSASATVPGLVNDVAQTFAGNKTFTGSISAANLSGTNTGDVTLGTADGLSLTGQVLSLGLSSTSTTGALSSTDWNTFNNKQPALTFGNLTDVGTDGITITGGTGAVVGSGTSISQQVADASHNGYLSSADWSTFNAKQPAGSYITALTGDVSASGPGSAAATVNSVGGQTATTVATATTLVTGSKSQNFVLAGPTSGSGAATFRALVSGDIPNLSATYVTQSEVGQPSGVASLDASGKVPVSQLPSVVMEYQGAWNPNTNTPTLVDGTGTNGSVYYVTAARSAAVSGLTDPSMYNFQIGDLVIYSSSVGKWQLATPAAGVQSVNGAQGAVTVNAINQLTGDVTTSAASGSQSEAATIAAGAVTLSKMANLAADTIIGNNTASPATPLALTGTQVTALLSPFSTAATTQGVVPGSNGATTSFLRGDGTWATPAGTGVTAVSVASANGFAGTSSGGTTPALTLSTTITGILSGNGTAISAAQGSAYSFIGNNTSSSAALSSLQSLVLGTPGFSDTGIASQITTSGSTSYFQAILQNPSSTSAASTDFIVANNNATATTYYGDFGINSSGFTGTGSLQLANATYLYSQSGDLVLGTNTSNAIHMVANNGATDAMTISAAGGIIFPALTGYMYANGSSVVTAATTIPVSALTPAGTQGNVLISNGASAPSFSATPTLAGIVNTTNVLKIEDSTDNTKVIAMNASGNTTAITLTLASQSSTSQTLKFPNITAADTLASLGLAQTFSAAQTFTAAPTFSSVTASQILNVNASKALTSIAYSTTPTASAIAEWDANKNLSANALIPASTSTATAAGTTTLTITSTETQIFTGTTTQTVKLPTTSVVAGGQYTIINQSTGVVTVQSSGANTIVALPASTQSTFTALVATPTTATNWASSYIAAGTGTVTSVTFTGDGTVLSSTPSSAVTTSGTVTATLKTQTAGTFLAGPTSGSAAAPTFRALQAPTTQVFTSSSGTYTSPAGVLYITVEVQGGGAGGQGSGTSPGGGVSGGNSTFSTVTANGGSNVAGSSAGGTASGGYINVTGGSSNGAAGATNAPGAGGGISYFGGGGIGGSQLGGGNANGYGSGGAGGGSTATVNTGGGGGAGGYARQTFAAGSYSYAVGAGGSGGAAGTGGATGGNGQAGIIIVTEYYQ